jgi:hypothetical protein
MRRQHRSDSPEIVAQRTLRSLDERQDIQVLVYRPAREQADQEEWSCRIEVRLIAAEPLVVMGRGIDSLQALFTALGGVRNALGERLKNITWLGEPRGIGFPKMIQDDDPDFLTLIDHLLEAEYSRQLLTSKRQQALRSRKPSRRRN